MAERSRREPRKKVSRRNRDTEKAVKESERRQECGTQKAETENRRQHARYRRVQARENQQCAGGIRIAV